MVNQDKGFFHFHLRKRMTHKLEPYPHPHPLKNFMDKAIFVIGVIGPLMTLPQLLKIWIQESAEGVSLLSWGSYIFTSSFWLVYALMHKEKPLIITYSLWIVIEIFIVIGIVLYR